jgi:hypothetical protein
MLDQSTSQKGRKMPHHLPSPNTRRWTPNRTMAVIQAIKDKRLEVEDAIAQYGFSLEEIESLTKRANGFGVNGLRSGRIQKYRKLMATETAL